MRTIANAAAIALLGYLIYCIAVIAAWAYIIAAIIAILEFLATMKQYLADQKKAHPELDAPMAKLQRTLQDMESRVARRQEKIQSPDVVARMNDEFRKNLLDYEGPDALDRVRAYTKDLVEIGGNQDDLVAECRRVVKELRQQAGLLMALDSRIAPVLLTPVPAAVIDSATVRLP